MMSKLCHNFGLPETCTTDGGSQYIAGDVKEFFRGLGIKHRISSVAFPHGNQKAEKSVGAAKRLIRDTVKVTGEFDEVKLMKVYSNCETLQTEIQVSPQPNCC